MKEKKRLNKRVILSILEIPVDIAVLALGIPLQMLIRITKLSFAHIRYDILIKVIRRSMAAEILTGLLILIAAFSVGLYCVEPGKE